MKSPRRGWLLIALVALVCGAAIWTVVHLRSRSMFTLQGLAARLPKRDAIVLSVDFDTLRRAGILRLLADSKMAQEPEYRDFVARTGFDYQKDLSAALVSFHPDGVFFLLRGRFDWNRFHALVSEQGGTCRNEFCRVGGSSSSRRISFFALKPDLMALAVSPDESAANRLTHDDSQSTMPIDLPPDPVWVLIPAARFKDPQNLPPGTHMFAKTLANAEKISLALGPQGEQLQIKLAVTCPSPQEASELAAGLEGATNLLRALITREKKTPNPRDLSGLLTSGAFSHQDRRVFGYWPLQRSFLEALAEGVL